MVFFQIGFPNQTPNFSITSPRQRAARKWPISWTTMRRLKRTMTSRRMKMMRRACRNTLRERDWLECNWRSDDQRTDLNVLTFNASAASARAQRSASNMASRLGLGNGRCGGSSLPQPIARCAGTESGDRGKLRQRLHWRRSLQQAGCRRSRRRARARFSAGKSSSRGAAKSSLPKFPKIERGQRVRAPGRAR